LVRATQEAIDRGGAALGVADRGDQRGRAKREVSGCKDIGISGGECGSGRSAGKRSVPHRAEL
jgi:hypothetical protein